MIHRGDAKIAEEELQSFSLAGLSPARGKIFVSAHFAPLR